MRVLMLTREFPPASIGGVAAHVDGLAGALARSGHDVVVFSVDNDGDLAPHAVTVDGVRVHRARTDLPWLPEDDEVLRTASANNQMAALVATIGDWRPDVVHAHDWHTAWTGDTLSALFDAPLVATFHSTERGRHGGHVPEGASSAINAVEAWLAYRSAAQICCSRFMMRELLEGLDPTNVELVPNGVDPRVWEPTGSTAREPLVLAWGRVQYEKGFQVLAQAMALLRGRVPGIRCVIAGRGSYLPELQSQVDIEGVSDLVNLAGFVPDDELRSLLHRAGCVVIPSLYEPFGIVALEALAAEAPTVAARTGGLAEIIEGTDAALLFEPGNARQLATTIERVLTDRALARDMQTKGREVLRSRFSWDAIATATATVYESVISDR
ncbi:MAG: glycosyltransferase family 1 protein [Acidimicrobiia bacterium]|nr:glycosyltransferase family 1 protein [Acidimicrobiia bacterium]